MQRATTHIVCTVEHEIDQLISHDFSSTRSLFQQVHVKYRMHIKQHTVHHIQIGFAPITSVADESRFVQLPPKLHESNKKESLLLLDFKRIDKVN